MVTRAFWLSTGIVALGLGIIGIALPLLPTTPFLLLAAFAFSKSSNRMHNWLVDHKTFGPLIQNWVERGAISRSAKWAATLSIGFVFGLAILLAAPVWALAAQGTILCGVLGFIWTRPD